MLKVTCALIVKGNDILLTQLGRGSSHPFQWEFPGGKIIPDESAEECIKREIMEELDINIEVNAVLEPVFHDYGFSKIQLIPFLCKIKSGEIKLNEHINFRWKNWKELSGTGYAGCRQKACCFE